MDLFDVARSCARRWYLCLPLLLIVGWFSYDAYSTVKPVYYAHAVVGLTPPSTKIYSPPQGVALARNGLLDIGGADLIANMTAVGLREPSALDGVVAGGGLPDYTSRLFPLPSGTQPLPMVMIEETAADPAAVTRTLELVIAQADKTLRRLQQQARVPEEEMVTPFVVSPPSVPTAGMPSRTRSTVAIFVAGAGLTVIATVFADILLSRLSAAMRRRRSAAAEVAAEPAEMPTEAPRPINAAPAGALEPR